MFRTSESWNSHIVCLPLPNPQSLEFRCTFVKRVRTWSVSKLAKSSSFKVTGIEDLFGVVHGFFPASLPSRPLILWFRSPGNFLKVLHQYLRNWFHNWFMLACFLGQWREHFSTCRFLLTSLHRVLVCSVFRAFFFCFIYRGNWHLLFLLFLGTWFLLHLVFSYQRRILFYYLAAVIYFSLQLFQRFGHGRQLCCMVFQTVPG